jgi:hypothetical protein
MIAASYFRDLDVEARPASDEIARPAFTMAPICQAPPDPDILASVDAVIELVAEATHLRYADSGQDVMPARPRGLLGSAASDDARDATLPHLKRLMAFVLRHDEPTSLARGRELAFLANTLLAGSSVQSRLFTPRKRRMPRRASATSVSSAGPPRFPTRFSQITTSSRRSKWAGRWRIGT